MQPELSTSAFEENKWVLHGPYQVGCSLPPKGRSVHRDLILAHTGDELVGGLWVKELNFSPLGAPVYRLTCPQTQVLVCLEH